MSCSRGCRHRYSSVPFCAAPAGAVKLGGLSLRPELAVLNVQIVETGPAGGRALFKARTCSLVSRLADIVAGERHAGCAQVCQNDWRRLIGMLTVKCNLIAMALKHKAG